MSLETAIAASELASTLTETGDEMQMLLKQLGKGKWKPDSSRERIEELRARVEDVTRASAAFIRWMAAGPFDKLMKAERLDAHEYHALRALGVIPDYFKLNGLGVWSEYDVYRFLYYADEKIQGIIETDLMHTERLAPYALAMGMPPIHPSDVQRHCLSEEQRNFLKVHFLVEYLQFSP